MVSGHLIALRSALATAAANSSFARYTLTAKTSMRIARHEFKFEGYGTPVVIRGPISREVLRGIEDCLDVVIRERGVMNVFPVGDSPERLAPFFSSPATGLLGVASSSLCAY